MKQQQNWSNKSTNQTQYKSTKIYSGGSSQKNISSQIYNQNNSPQYSKINTNISKNGKVIHRSTRRNIDEDGNAIITTKIVREIGQGNIGNNINSKSMIDSRSKIGNMSYGINNEQGRNYTKYSNYSNNDYGDNQDIMYDDNYEIYSPCSYNTQYQKSQKIEKYTSKGGDIPNYRRSPMVGNSSQHIEISQRRYNNYNIESPYNLSHNSPSNDFNSPDRQINDTHTQYFRNVQIEKIKGKSPIYNDKMNIRNNRIESSIKYGGYNDYQDGEDELLNVVNCMATLLQSNVRGFLVRKKVLRYITLAIYYQSFCDKLQDVLCSYVRRMVLNIFKNKLNSPKNNKYGTIRSEINDLSNNNYRKNNINTNYGTQLHKNNSYYTKIKTETNYNNMSRVNPYSNNKYNITKRQVTEYNTYKGTPKKYMKKDYTDIYEINKVTKTKNLRKDKSYQNNLTNGYKASYQTYNATNKGNSQSPSAKVIHYFINSPCSKKASHHRYYHEINNKTVNTKSYGNNQLNNHRTCHKCDEISRMKKQEKYYITTTVEKTEDEHEHGGYMNEYESTYIEEQENRQRPQEIYEYEENKNIEENIYDNNQGNQNMYNIKKNIENDNYLSVNYVKFPTKEEKVTTRDIYTTTTTDPNKISKVESINIKTSKKQKTEKEIEEEINRRVKITIIEKEKIEKEKRIKEEEIKREKERIEREKKEKERKEKEQKEKERKEKQERERKEREDKLNKEREEKRKKEEQMKIERQRIEEQKRIERQKIEEQKRIEREKEKQRKEEQMRIEKQKREEQIRLEKEKERKKKEEQLRIEKQRREEQLQKEREEKRKKEEQQRLEKEKERKKKEEQLRIEKQKREEQIRLEKEKERQRKEEQMRIEKQRKEELIRIQKEADRKLKEEKMKFEKEKERLKKEQELIIQNNIKTIKMQEEKKINMSEYILKKDCQKNLEDMKSKLEKDYEKKIALEKKRGQEEQKKYEEKLEIKNRKEIEKIMEQQKKKEIERQREIEREKENQKRKELELQKLREKEIKMGIQQEMEKQKEIMKQKELDEKNKKMKQIKISGVTQVNLKSLVDNTHNKTISRNIEKDKEKALKLIKKYILFRGNHLLKLRKYYNQWKLIVKNLELQELAKAIQDFCRGNLEISSIKRGITNWKNLSRKIFYKKRIKLLKMRSKYNLKKKKLYQLIRITKLHRLFSRRRFIHYIVLIWYIYAKNIHKKKVNMKFLYENLLRTYMSLAKDIFGNNQIENPSVQDAMYEAVNTNKFSTSYQDDVPLARQHYEELRRKKLREMKNKEYSSSTTKIEVEKKVINDENELSIDEQRKKELLNKFKHYKSMNRDLIWAKKNRYIQSIEKNYEERKNNSREISEDKSYKNKNNNNNYNNKYDYKVNNISTRINTEYNTLPNNNNIYSYNKVEIKSYTKPVENNKYNYNTNNSNNYTKGQKSIEIREYKQTTENSKYSNTSYPSRKTKSENKDNIVNNITTTKYTTTSNQNQKYTTSNKPSTSYNINVQSYGKGTNNFNNTEIYKSTYKKEVNTQGNNLIKTPSYTTYKKTEVTTYKKEETKPYVKNITTTKYESNKSTGNNNNNLVMSNVSVVSSSYQNVGTYGNKTSKNLKLNTSQNNSNVSSYQSKYVNTEGNIKDKKNDNKYMTKIERKVEIKTSGISSEKDKQGVKKITTTKSYVSSKINQ